MASSASNVRESQLAAVSADGACVCGSGGSGIEETLQSVLRDASVAVTVLASDGSVVWANQATDMLMGAPAEEVSEEVIGKRGEAEWLFFDGDGNRYDFMADVERCLQTRKPSPRKVLGIRRPDGSLLWADPEVIPVPACHCGARWHVAIVGRDLTEQRFAEQVLHRLAFFDPLTGLANRLVLEDRLEQSLRRRERAGAPAGLYFLDLDRFKPVNDQLGHEAGDSVLRSVATRIASTFRPQDTVARIGGDEFAVLVEGDDDPSAFITRAREAVELPVMVPVDGLDHSVAVGVSVGHAHADDSSSKESLLRRADEAMYRDKRLRHSDATR